MVCTRVFEQSSNFLTTFAVHLFWGLSLDMWVSPAGDSIISNFLICTGSTAYHTNCTLLIRLSHNRISVITRFSTYTDKLSLPRHPHSLLLNKYKTFHSFPLKFPGNQTLFSRWFSLASFVTLIHGRQVT